MGDSYGSDMVQGAEMDRVKMLAAGAGIGAAGIGAFYLALWLSGAMTYRGFEEITVKTNSALCLLLYGITLTVIAFGTERDLVRHAARMLALAALTIGALTWLEHLFGWDFGIDQFIAREAPGSLGTGHPNRMGPPGAMTYTVVGLALLLLLRRRSHSVRIVQSLGLFICLVAFTGMLGYFYGVVSLYGTAQFTIISWPSTIGNFLLGTGLLFLRPREGLMTPVTALDPGGAAVRRLLPPAVAIPIFLGWLHLKGESVGLYERHFGSSILVLSWIIIFSFLVYRVGAWISRSAAAIRDSEAKFRAVFRQAAVGMGRVSFADARWIDVNDAFCRMLGYSTDEILTIPWPEMTHPDDVDLDLVPFRRMAAGELETYSIEKRFIHKQGRHVWARLSLSLVRDTAGRPDYEIAVIEDVTERKRAEENLMRTVGELERSNRELQQFAYISSHDLQEPLRTVASYTELLQKRYRGKLDEKADRYIAYVVEAAQRMSALIRDLLEYSLVTGEEKQSRPISVEAVLKRAMENLSVAVRESGAAISHDPLPDVIGDNGQLVRLFQNLLENALKYRNREVQVRVHVSAARQGDEWVFGVHDNGIGLEPEFYDKIFRMFQRLHQREEFAGTGMGLAICRKIVERHSGRMWVESKQGEGSTFYFSLPAMKGEADVP